MYKRQNEGRAEVENEFTRAVTREGNAKAKALVAEVFELRRSFEWRGLGEVPYSALAIKPAYRAFDVEARYGISYRSVPDNKACECGAIPVSYTHLLTQRKRQERSTVSLRSVTTSVTTAE